MNASNGYIPQGQNHQYGAPQPYAVPDMSQAYPPPPPNLRQQWPSASPGHSSMPVPPPAAPAAPIPTYPAPSVQVAQAAAPTPVQHMQPVPQYGQPVQQFQVPQQFQPPMQPTPTRSFESIVGKNVIGIIAAFLIFLGLLFLGFLVVPNMYDFVKIALLFFVSLSLTAVGAVLTFRQKNAFTVALLGCGSASVFISILLSHAFFQVIPDLAAYGLLLGWLVGSLALVKLSDSRFLSILVHAGVLLSLCFGYAVGMPQERIVFLLIYQALAVALIVVGNKLCYTKSYSLGLLCSLGFSFIAVCIMFGYYQAHTYAGDILPTMIAIIAFVIQVGGAAFLSFILYRDVDKMENRSLRITLHVINKVTLMLVFFVALFLFSGYILDTSLLVPSGLAKTMPLLSLYLATGVTAFGAVVHILIDALLQRNKLSKGITDVKLETISVFSMAIFAAFLLFVSYVGNALLAMEALFPPTLIFVAFVVAVCAQLTGIKNYSVLAWAILGIDFLLMLMDGFGILVDNGAIWAAIMYLLVYVGLITFEWARSGKDGRSRLLAPFTLTLLIVYELSISTILDEANIEAVIIALALSIPLLALSIARIDLRAQSSTAYWVTLRVNEILVVLVGAVLIAYYTPHDIFFVTSILLAATNLAILALLLVRIKYETRFNISWLSVFVGICFTFTMLGAVGGMIPWIEGPLVSSTTMMITALICVIAGFVLQIKPLRLYGLILVVICVVKLVTLDIIDAEATMRVVAFIVGGLICFGISALYNYSVKRFDEYSKN